MNNPASSPRDYRWLKIEHPDLDFWGIKPPLPWPKDAPKLDKDLRKGGRFPL